MNKQQRKPPNTSFLCLPCFSITCSFILAALVAVVCRAADPSVQTALLTIVHYNQLLAWFKASGLQYTNNTGPALILLLGNLIVARSQGDPASMVLQDQFLHVLHRRGGPTQSAGYDTRIVAELVSLGLLWNSPPQVRGRASSPASPHQGQLSCVHGEECGQISQCQGH